MEEDQGPAPSTGATKKKHEDKHRKKDQRSWDNLLKSVLSFDEEEKRLYIEEKYRDLYNEMRRLTASNQQLTRQVTAMQKENDHTKTELAKNIIGRGRMESLCRELQKQNKQIKDENMAKIKEEEERRKEVSLKFADKLSDINNMMDENKEKSDKLREENQKMTAKLADLYSQFQKREEDIAKMSHQLELERQFSHATLKKMELEILAEKEMHEKEQAIMKSNLEKSEANCCVLLETVKGLQDHIDVYKNQYEGFESTMAKSAKVFDNFKLEIAAMKKQVTTLEQEAQSWKNKFHDSMKALVEMSELKKTQDSYTLSLEKKNDQLNKLCRQLQIDRSNYLKLLKTHGIEPTPSSPKVEEEPKKAVSPKMTKKEKELQQLKDSLKAVQEELTRISVEETEKLETSKTEQPTSQEGAEVESIEEETQSEPNSSQNNADTSVVEEVGNPNEPENQNGAEDVTPAQMEQNSR